MSGSIISVMGDCVNPLFKGFYRLPTIFRGIFTEIGDVTMNYSFLLDNQRKRREYSLKHLCCFAMFCFWQMGFIYFMGPALNIDGRTPLPIDMDNLTVLMAGCYVLSITYMIFLPRYVVWAERLFTLAAIATVLGLFLPLPDEALKGLIYAHVFCCCTMIGFETFIIVNFLSEKSAINALTAGYGLALFLIALVQNDFLAITFPVFRVVTVAALLLLLVFAFHLPASPKACPRYVRKDSGLVAPKKLLTGTFILVFVSSLMGVSGPSISAEVRHGVFVTYFVDAAASVLLFYLYQKKEFHPFRCISACVGLSCIGFLLMYAADFVPVLKLISCALLGFGMVACQMVPLYGLVLMKSYPSRYLSPVIIGLALVAVLVQGGMVEAFRSAPSMLFLAYGVIMVILVILYLQVEPYFLYTLRRKIPEEVQQATTEPAIEEEPPYEKKENAPAKETLSKDSLFAVLSKRELEVVDLIARGYSNAEIANVLVISVHTVNDHTKKIYRKLNVHSRLEVAALANRQKEPSVEN